MGPLICPQVYYYYWSFIKSYIWVLKFPLISPLSFNFDFDILSGVLCCPQFCPNFILSVFVLKFFIQLHHCLHIKFHLHLHLHPYYHTLIVFPSLEQVLLKIIIRHTERRKDGQTDSRLIGRHPYLKG